MPVFGRKPCFQSAPLLARAEHHAFTAPSALAALSAHPIEFVGADRTTKALIFSMGGTYVAAIALTASSRSG